MTPPQTVGLSALWLGPATGGGTRYLVNRGLNKKAKERGPDTLLSDWLVLDARMP